MKLSRFILPALLFMVCLCCLLCVISSQRSHIYDVESPAVSGTSVIVPGYVTTTDVLTQPNFQTVLHALEQRNGIQRLPEPEVVTTHHLAVNQIFDPVFNLPVTNK